MLSEAMEAKVRNKMDELESAHAFGNCTEDEGDELCDACLRLAALPPPEGRIHPYDLFALEADGKPYRSLGNGVYEVDGKKYRADTTVKPTTDRFE